MFALQSFANRSKDPSKQDPTEWMDDIRDDGIFDDLNDTAKSVGYSGYTLAQLLGRIVLQIVGSIIAVTFMWKKKSQDVKESKEWLGNAAKGALLLFGLNFLIGILFDIALKIG
ncbi:MAG: hypothetical protein MJA82_02090 [Clostridia bacterium]|nr:hypothetical protein [Clostridia bacterium]